MRFFSKLSIIIGILCGILHVYAADTDPFVVIHCESPGSLVLSNESRIATNLKVTGEIDARDIAKLGAVTINVTQILDLSETNIHGYYGKEGTLLDLSPSWIVGDRPTVDYPANTFPVNAFAEVRDNSLSKYVRGSASLRKLILPATLTGFMTDALGDCYGLVELVAPANSTTIKSEDHIVYSYDGKTLLAVAPSFYGDLIVKESVTTIAEGAFYGMKPASVTFKSSSMPIFGEKNDIDAAYIIAPNPDSYKQKFPEIDCFSSMETITVNNTVPGQLLTMIGNQGYGRSDVRALKVTGTLNYDDFEQVTSLPNLHIADLSEATVTMTAYKDFTFTNPSVTQFKFPRFSNTAYGSVFALSISSSARLYGDLVVPEGTYTFASSSPRFTSAVFPSTLSSMDSWVFSEMSCIRSADFSKCRQLTTVSGFNNAGSLTEVKLPEGLQKISGLGGPIRSINLPNTIKDIISQGGWEIEKLILPSALTYLNIASLPCVKEIDCSQAKSLSELYGLGNTPRLKKLDLREAPITFARIFQANWTLSNSAKNKPQRLVVTGGSPNAAVSVAGIEELLLPSTLTTLEGINLCANLKTLDLMQCFRLKTIKGIEDCTALETVKLPESVSSIEGFNNCPALKNFSIAATVPPVVTTNPDLNPMDFSQISLTIPSGTMGAYRMADGWEKCKEINDNAYRVSVNMDELNAKYDQTSKLLIYGAGVYPAGTEATLDAYPFDRFEVGGWWIDDMKYFVNPYTFTVNSNVSVYPAYTMDQNNSDILMTLKVPVGQTFKLSVSSDHAYDIIVDGGIYAQYKGNGNMVKETFPIYMNAGTHAVSINGENLAISFGEPQFTQRNDIFTITAFDVKSKYVITDLTAKYFDVEELDLSGCFNLRNIEIEDNCVVNNLKAQNSPALKYLLCTGATVHNVDVTSCNLLIDVSANKCEMQTFACKGSGVRSVSLNNNNLKKLDFTRCPYVAQVFANNNELTEFTMTSTVCYGLYLDNNPMAFSTLTSLMYNIYVEQWSLYGDQKYVLDFKVDTDEINSTGYCDLSAQMFPPQCTTRTQVMINGEPAIDSDGLGLIKIPYGENEIRLTNEFYHLVEYVAHVNSEYKHPNDDVKTIEDSDSHVRVVNNTIIIDSPVETAIYTIKGQLIFKGKSGKLTDLPTDIYLVIEYNDGATENTNPRKIYIK